MPTATATHGAPAPLLQRLPVQITLAALLPIVLVSLAISAPLIEGRRTQLRAQEQLRAVQAGQTTQLLAQEQIRFAGLLANLLADQLDLRDRLRDGDLAGVRAFVRQTRADTLFDLVTVVDPAGQVLAQDGLARLWRPELAIDSAPIFWGAPGLGLVAQVVVPLSLAEGRRGALIGSFLVDRPLITLVRSQADLEQRIIVGGRLVASSLLAADQPVAPLGGAGELAEATIAGTAYLVVSTPLRDPGGAEIATVEILVPLTPLRTAQEQATLVLLGSTLLAATTAILIGWVLARRITRPIALLERSAERIGRGELGRPVAVSGPAEIRLLSATIEWMRRQIAGTQAALQAEKARYANVLESIAEAVITSDAGGRVTSINRSAERLLGQSRGQAIGSSLGDLIALADGAPLLPQSLSAVGSAQIAISTRSDTQLIVAVTHSTISADGAGGDEHVLVMRDVSDEAALGQLKEAFLANVTHEFRTPLAALIASIELLRDEQEPLTADEHRQMLDAVQVGVRRLDTLVQNLLDSASLQAGYFRVEPEPARLPPLIDEALQLIHPLIQQRAQSVRVELAELPPVLADGRRVVQVLVNLLSNASKFAPRGDRLVLTARGGAAEVQIAVTDHGPGIPAQRRPRLFERFLRPGEEIVAEQGVGLGLAIARAIVERHGGRIWVEEAQGGRGTTFAFTLRRA